MKLKKLLRKIIMSAAAVCMAAAMSVTSFAADPVNIGTITVPGSVVTPGQVYNPAKEKEDRTSVGKVKAGYSIKIGFNDKYDIYAKCEKAG